MTFIKRLTALALSVTMSLMIMTTGASAASQAWNGQALKSGGTYTVSGTVRINTSVIIPENTTLEIKKGGSLLIYGGGSLSIAGTLKINSGANVVNSGTLTVERSGTLKNMGVFKSTISAALIVKGAALNYLYSDFRVSSQTLVYKGARMANSGDMFFLASSSVTSSGLIRNTLSGDIMIQGTMKITVSGRLYSYGYVSVGIHAAVTISGSLDLKEKSGYNNFGTVVTTLSGKITDNSEISEKPETTVKLLIDQPELISKGIDVSWAQGEIDWAKVAASGVKFAIIRAGRGPVKDGETSPQLDTYFKKNIEGAIANGIDVGVYFYSYALTTEAAREEAEFFIRSISNYKISYPVILDMEEDDGFIDDANEIVETFFKVVTGNGYYPMLYSYKNWFEVNLDRRILDKYAVWIAELKDAPTYQGGYYIWQYSHTGRVNGINGEVDLNYSYRNFPQIFRIAGLNHLS